ncbi:unnamed protein product [Pocillopora meandrina]|uniref:Membrane insertase YidC/Oxa/ALB C-terminal domain-containing protein n=1 Tax=Pocillopora meandrina TaxID=46732 RepID=A0AAU9XR33_9CNID|nr:unnamed protein product [Pocillopora meandrina]
MAAVFARFGNWKIGRAAACLRTLRVSGQSTNKMLNRYIRDVASRTYSTTGLYRRVNFGRPRNFKIYGYSGVRHELSPWIKGARCFSLFGSQSSSPSPDNTELLQEEKVTNPFVQENDSGSVLESMATGSEMFNDLAGTLTSVGEPSLASLGLGGWGPTGIIQQGLEFIHVTGGLSWCASIAVTTVCIRLLLLPLIVKSQANTARLNNARPELQEVELKMRELSNSTDSAAQAQASAMLGKIYRENNCHPVKSLLAIVAQFPVFISFFFAIRGMANLPVESFKTGGYLWFQDLTLCDPYYVLPIMCSFSMLASLELGGEVGVRTPHMETMKTVFRIMAVALIPFTAHFPAAIFCYWVTSNLFTIVQVGFLKSPSVRRALGIPEMIKHENLQDAGSFLENLKAGFQNSQEEGKLRHAEKMKKQRLKALGEAPLETTYEFNPRIEQNQEIFSLSDSEKKSDKRGRNRRRMLERLEKPAPQTDLRIKFNQEYFSAKAHQQAKEKE